MVTSITLHIAPTDSLTAKEISDFARAAEQNGMTPEDAIRDIIRRENASADKRQRQPEPAAK